MLTLPFSLHSTPALCTAGHGWRDRATCSKAQSRTSGLFNRAGQDEVTTTRKGRTPEPAGSKARPPGKSGSWTVLLGAQKLISFQILHMPFIELTDSWASVSEAAGIFSPFSEGALYDEYFLETLSHCPFVSLCFCYWVHMNNYQRIWHGPKGLG